MRGHNRKRRQYDFQKNNAKYGNSSNYMSSPMHLVQPNPFFLPQHLHNYSFKKPKWNAEDAEKAIQTEINICKNRKSIVMTLPDLPVCTKDIYSIDPAIRYVKFEKNLSPRPCYVNYKTIESVDKITTELKKLKYNNKSPKIEVQCSEGPVDKKCPNNIDPYVLYISNIEDLSSNHIQLTEKYAPGVITISGVEEWNKKTFFVNMSYASVDLAIEAMERNFKEHFKFNNRRLKVRFLRSNHKISNKDQSNPSNSSNPSSTTSNISSRKRSSANISSNSPSSANLANSEHSFISPDSIKEEAEAEAEVNYNTYQNEENISFMNEIKVEPLDF